MQKVKEEGNPTRQKKISKIALVSPSLSIITLNVHRSNYPIKKHRGDEWIKIQDPTICCIQETHFRLKDTYRLKVKG